MCIRDRLETLKCEVKELTRDEAIIVMVESNLQRSVISVSYTHLDVYKRQRHEQRRHVDGRGALTGGAVLARLVAGYPV